MVEDGGQMVERREDEEWEIEGHEARRKMADGRQGTNSGDDDLLDRH